MSAASKREELESAIWHRVRDSAARPINLDRKGMEEILAAADAYADAKAAEAIARVTGETAARLAQADAEVHRRSA